MFYEENLQLPVNYYSGDQGLSIKTEKNEVEERLRLEGADEKPSAPCIDKRLRADILQN